MVYKEMTSQLIKKETRVRGGIKSNYTAWMRVYKSKFEDDMPKHSIAGYNRLLDYGERKIERLKIEIERLQICEKEYEFVFKNWKETKDMVNRLLLICENQKQQIKDLEDKTYNAVDFEIYDKKETETCSICYDDILINQHIHTCKTCNKSIHSQCFLYLEDKSKCPCCRGIVAQ